MQIIGSRMSNYVEKWRFFEGWLEHKGKQGRGYQLLWCVLKGRTIHIFKERDIRSDDTVVGSLNIDNKTECTTSDTKEGYKLELITEGLDKTKRANRFKAKKKVERELWKGYILGLSKGTVPTDLDLTVTQIEEMKASVNSFLLEESSGLTNGGTSPSIGGKSNHQELSKRASVSPSEDSGLGATIKHPKSIGTQNSSSSGSRGTISGGGGGPTMRHKFTNNPRMDDHIPSWFFLNCGRDLAERILVNSAGHLGNTLMRESSSQKVSGSYVLSKLGKIDGIVKIEHFEIERVDRGFKIKVENDHEPQKNLTDVINTFRFIAGFDNTIPMKTNDLYDFGLSEDDSNPYRMKRIEREIPRTRELPEPLPDYEEPAPRPSKTFNPGILKKEQAKYERRTAHHFGTTRSSIVNKFGKATTVKPRPPSPEFDPPAPHRECLYYNDLGSNTPKPCLQKPRPPAPRDDSPPPPEPHNTGSDGYYNENSFKDKRSMSVPNIKHLMPKQLQEDLDLHQPVNRDIPPPKSVVPEAPPPPPLLPTPAVTSPTQKTPASILKSKARGGLPSLPSQPPAPDSEPRSSVDTSVPSLAALGLKPVAKILDKQPTTSSSLPPNHVPSPQQLGLRHVERTTNKEELATKEYEDSQTVQDIRKRFEKKIPPSTAPKPTGRPQARVAAAEGGEDEIYHDAISVEYETSNDIPKGIGKRSSFIRKLEEQIARPAPGPQGAPKVPEIKPMTEEEELEYDKVN